MWFCWGLLFLPSREAGLLNVCVKRPGKRLLVNGLPLLKMDYEKICTEAHAFFTKGQVEMDDLLESVQSAVCLSRLRDITRRSA